MTIFEQLRAGVATSSGDEMRDLAATLAQALYADTTLALHGDLGVGKTTFVQGLARGLGIADSITSPTFTLYNLHRGPTWQLASSLARNALPTSVMLAKSDSRWW